jgi:hypothetical protein
VSCTTPTTCVDPPPHRDPRLRAQLVSTAAPPVHPPAADELRPSMSPPLASLGPPSHFLAGALPSPSSTLAAATSLRPGLLEHRTRHGRAAALESSHPRARAHVLHRAATRAMVVAPPLHHRPTPAPRRSPAALPALAARRRLASRRRAMSWVRDAGAPHAPRARTDPERREPSRGQDRRRTLPRVPLALPAPPSSCRRHASTPLQPCRAR